MNRRKFLAGLGAALAAVAATTRLGQSTLALSKPLNLPEGDFSTDTLRYKTTERYSQGWTDWKGVVGSSSENFEETPVVFNGRKYEVATFDLKDTVVDEKKVPRELFASKDAWFLQDDNVQYLKRYHHTRIDGPFQI